MTNAEIIVSTLDSLLDHEVSLVLYGRAAIALGFHSPPAEVGKSMDVDILLRFSDAPKLDPDDQFWDAQAEVNIRLEKQGLYMTHLFTEAQVFLRPDWEQFIVPIDSVRLKWLRLHRPATIYLILTKMMRGDDRQDMDDVAFMIRHDKISSDQLEEAFTRVVIPDLQEYRDAFEKARRRVREIVSRVMSDA